MNYQLIQQNNEVKNMVTIRKIKKRFVSNICRQCINKTYNIHLLHTDCKYGLMYPGLCPVCKEMKNIVTGLRLSGYWKLLTK